MTDRKKPGVAFWATVVVVVGLVAYPLSFGPACWWFSLPRSDGPWLISMSDAEPHAPQIYWPIGWLTQNGPESIRGIIEWYGTLGKNIVWLPADRSGHSWTAIANFRDEYDVVGKEGRGTAPAR
jgi:hypothetical protein